MTSNLVVNVKFITNWIKKYPCMFGVGNGYSWQPNVQNFKSLPNGYWKSK